MSHFAVHGYYRINWQGGTPDAFVLWIDALDGWIGEHRARPGERAGAVFFRT